MSQRNRILSLFVAHSMLMGIIGGCARASGSLMPCETRSDCDPTEQCVGGACVMAAESAHDAGFMMRSLPDAALPGLPDASGYHRPDSGVVAQPDPVDSGTPDSGATIMPPVADAGSSDAGSAPDAAPITPDAGCPSPIVVMGGGAYCSIMEAVLAAPSGATLLVPAGTYAEDVSIAKPLTLRGPAYTTAPLATIAPTPGAPALVVVAAGVVVENFAFSANGGTGIEILGAASLDLHNAVVSNAKNIGIDVMSTANLVQVTISNTTGDGIDMISGSHCTLTNSIIQDSTQIGAYAAGATLTMHGSSILRSGTVNCNRNNPNNCAPGLLADYNATVVVDMASKIDGNGLSGLIVQNGSSLTLQGSEVNNNGTYHEIDANNPVDGVSLGGAGNVIILQNTISNNYGFGLDCAQSNVSQCSNNTIRNNNYGGSSCGGC